MSNDLIFVLDNNNTVLWKTYCRMDCVQQDNVKPHEVVAMTRDDYKWVYTDDITSCSHCGGPLWKSL